MNLLYIFKFKKDYIVIQSLPSSTDPVLGLEVAEHGPHDHGYSEPRLALLLLILSTLMKYWTLVLAVMGPSPAHWLA